MIKLILGVIIGLILGGIFGSMTMYNMFINFTTEKLGDTVKGVLTSTGSNSGTITSIPSSVLNVVSQKINDEIAKKKVEIKAQIEQSVSNYIHEKLTSWF